MKSTFLILILSLFSWTAHAQSSCYLGETDPRTGKVFASDNDYQDELARWQSKAPSMPGPISLLRAYRVYSAEKDRAAAMKSDKLAHCYMGCRISQTTDYATADYVGWLKEDRDIKDCRKTSHYDEHDYIATLRGAQLGETQNTAQECLRACEQIY